jgi:hypothetical protein
MLALAVICLTAMLAGSASGAPTIPIHEAVLDQFQPVSPAVSRGYAIAPEVLLECIACPYLGPVNPTPAAGEDSTPLKEVEVIGAVPQEVTDKPDAPVTPEVPETPATPETPNIPATPEEPETPPVSTEQPPVTSSKLPNTGTRLILLALGALALIGAAPMVGKWADYRRNKS